ncbi:TetR/AcrR family transcriptional regulator [Mycobacterium sherrisii]|uniref:TetR/AcrR family transcriptional regulator n=1 Tax=Mycobacterium sherrisii TaxID=243061 RepID=UPI0039769440
MSTTFRQAEVDMEKRKRPSLAERRAGELRLDIARAARDLFIAQGDTSATIEQICDTVGIVPRTFHRHFPAKEDVLGPLFRRSETIMTDVLTEAAIDADPVDVLVDVFTSEVIVRQSPDFDRKFMALMVNTPQYRLRWMEWGESLCEPITEFLSTRFDLGADEFLRCMPARLVVHISRHAYMVWAEGKESDDTAALVDLHRRGIGQLIAGLRSATSARLA